MAEPKDLTGKRFGRLVAIRLTDQRINNHCVWECKCDCGAITYKHTGLLCCGRTSSCGCYFKEVAGIGAKKHGLHGTKIYNTWSSMIERCYSKTHRYYSDYGGRGITVCDRWKNSVAAFVEDMGPKPSSKHSLGRIDNDKGYCKENCAWQTQSEQMGNTRSSVMVEINGVKKCVTHWCKESGISSYAALARIAHGWDPIKAVTTPIRKRVPVTNSRYTLVTIGGVERSFSEWCNHFGIDIDTAFSRLRHGWTLERAASTPARHRSNRIEPPDQQSG